MAGVTFPAPARHDGGVRGRSPGRPRQTTHDEIRDTALGLFDEHGYGATSLVAVAAAAGISRTTLFSYFPAKRDLIWEDHDRALARLEEAWETAADGPVVDLLVVGMLATAPYTIADHAVLARRWRIARDDDELRAHASLRTKELVETLIDTARRRAPGTDPALVDHVARALMAVASRCTEEWAQRPTVDQDLPDFTAERLRPIADALRPLLS